MARIGVIDVETTGLRPLGHDRVVEVAAVVIQPDGTVLREFVTLLDPERDLGPTSIHGLTARDVIGAPRFRDIAGMLLEVLHGCVALAGHNVGFDHSFLTSEFGRLGFPFPDGPLLCTMQLAGGGSLSSVCSDYGVRVEGETHTAYCDAFAAAQLLVKILDDAPLLVAEISQWPAVAWPNVPRSSVKLATRDDSRRREAWPPTYLQRLLANVSSEPPLDDNNPAMVVYTDLLTRVLEDRRVDEEEGRLYLISRRSLASRVSKFRRHIATFF